MASNESSHIGKRVVYRGHVQGVGFRYTVNSIARRFRVVGYVRNLDNGTVELVVRADGETIRNFLGEITKAFHGYIRDESAEEFDPGETFDRFNIRL